MTVSPTNSRRSPLRPQTGGAPEPEVALTCPVTGGSHGVREISIHEVVSQTSFSVRYSHPGCEWLHPEDKVDEFEAGGERIEVSHEQLILLLEGNKSFSASQVRQIRELGKRFTTHVKGHLEREERIQDWERNGTGEPYYLGFDEASQVQREDLYAQLANNIAEVIFGDSIVPEIGSHYLGLHSVRQLPVQETVAKLADKNRVREAFHALRKEADNAHQESRLDKALAAFERRVDKVMASDKHRHPWNRAQALVKCHQRLSQKVTEVLYPAAKAIREMGFEWRGEKRTWTQWSPEEIQQLSNTQPVMELLRSLWLMPAT